MPAPTSEARLRARRHPLGDDQGAVFPHSFGGMVGAVMLGLGRAMGETIAVALVIGASHPDHAEPLRARRRDARRHRPNQFGESSGDLPAALIGLGVVLFVITVVVNLLAPASSCAGPRSGMKGA